MHFSKKSQAQNEFVSDPHLDDVAVSNHELNRGPGEVHGTDTTTILEARGENPYTIEDNAEYNCAAVAASIPAIIGKTMEKVPHTVVSDEYAVVDKTKKGINPERPITPPASIIEEYAMVEKREQSAEHTYGNIQPAITTYNVISDDDYAVSFIENDLYDT